MPSCVTSDREINLSQCCPALRRNDRSLLHLHFHFAATATINLNFKVSAPALAPSLSLIRAAEAANTSMEPDAVASPGQARSVLAAGAAAGKQGRHG